MTSPAPNLATICLRSLSALVLAGLLAVAGAQGCQTHDPKPQGDGYDGYPIIPGTTNVLPPPAY